MEWERQEVEKQEVLFYEIKSMDEEKDVSI